MRFATGTPATAARLNGFGIHTGLGLRNQTLEFLEANFGKAGGYYYSISRGRDERPVRANRIRKSVGAENTFAQYLSEFEPMVANCCRSSTRSGVIARNPVTAPGP
jgi:DNA polymerase-4